MPRYGGVFTYPTGNESGIRPTLSEQPSAELGVGSGPTPLCIGVSIRLMRVRGFR